MNWGNLAGLVVLGAVVGACASANDEALAPEKGASTTTTAPPAETGGDGAMELVWSTEGVRFASAPQEVRGTDLVVAMTIGDDSDLTLVAHDAATGDELWHRVSTASMVTRGVQYEPLVSAQTVVHMAPSDEDGGGDVVEAVDAESGEVQWVSPSSPEGFDSPLHACGGDVCVTAVGRGDEAGLWQLDLDTGELSRPGSPIEALVSTPLQAPPGRYLGSGLYELDDNGDIASVEDGKVVWRRSPIEMFGGADVEPSNGWAFRPSGEDLIVGWLGPAVEQVDNGEVELVDSQMAGIDRATGETVWLEAGEPGCGRIYSLRLIVDRTLPWLRCTTQGVVTIEDGAPTSYSIDQFAVSGFDPETGKADWTVELGAVDAIADPAGVVVRLDDHRFTVRLEDGSLFGLNVATGERFDVDPGQVGWCFANNEYDYEPGPGDALFRVGSEFAQPCTVEGKPQPTPAEPDDLVGVTVDRTFIWMDQDGLHGARRADPGA